VKAISRLRYEFVEYIPDKAEDGILYVSTQYATAIHRCCCGCGREVVTPLSPTDWKIVFDGETVSLSPSIGNWSFECQSHYWVDRNVIRWAPRWSPEQIAAGRHRDQAAKGQYYGAPPLAHEAASLPTVTERGKPWWHRLGSWLLKGK